MCNKRYLCVQQWLNTEYSSAYSLHGVKIVGPDRKAGGQAGRHQKDINNSPVLPSKHMCAAIKPLDIHRQKFL
jgi:hypothetical protein